MQTLEKQTIVTATKWSFVAEFSAKMIVPITNMILARILAPEAFGIIATINMIISFTDMMSTAGFQKYIIQHEFKDKKSLYESANIAFWTNFVLSIAFFIAIFLMRDILASWVGTSTHGNAIAVACFSLPLTSFSSIQEALFSRDLDYKLLFYNRLVAICVPFLVTIPLALMGADFWSLIIGTICGQVVKSFYLTYYSKWKPGFYYNVDKLKEMLSFGTWTLFESIALWASAWIDIFIISNHLGDYYTGIYKTSQTTVTGILSIITAATTGVLFSSLSRYQNDTKKFIDIFQTFQKNVGLLVLPIGVGIFVYSDLITKVLLGDQWLAGSQFIGIWGLCTALVSVYGTFCRECYRAKGLPKLSLFIQVLHLIFVIPVCYIGVRMGFEALSVMRSLAYLQIIILHIIFMKLVFHISPLLMFKNTLWPLICSLVMGGCGFLLLQFSNAMLYQFITIFLCILIYFLLICIHKGYRHQVFTVIKNLERKIRVKV